MNNDNLIEYFFLKNVKLEQTLIKLQESGIDIGYNIQKSTNVIDTDLFPYRVWADAEKSSEFYKIYFSMENSIRDMIFTVLLEKYGLGWLKRIPENILNEMKRFKKQEEESGIETSDAILDYADFGHLIVILEHNKRDFDNIGNMTRAKQILSDFVKSRNIIAHCRKLTDDEKDRFLVSVKTWLRII